MNDSYTANGLDTKVQMRISAAAEAWLDCEEAGAVATPAIHQTKHIVAGYGNVCAR